jgi:two-component system OmpR family sensor kinase
MIQARSLRFRMMALFCAVVGVLLGASHLAFYVVFRREILAQLDRQLVETAMPVAADLAVDPDVSDVAELNIPDEYFEVLDPSGRVSARSRNLGPDLITVPVPPANFSHFAFEELMDPERGRMRLVLIPFQNRMGAQVLALAVPTRDADDALLTFRRMILVLFPVSLLVTAAVSAWYVGRSLRPVAELTRQARNLVVRAGEGNRHDVWRPLAVPNLHDELGRLAETFNDLFASLNSALRQLRQFVSDASHELRTPLSVLRGETELMLSEPRTPEDYQKTLRSIEEELKKLSRIVEGLFTLAMADAGQLRLAHEPLYLDEVLGESCALAAPLARAKDIAIECDLKEDVFHLGDEPFLRQLFLIFLDNALKYSPSHSRIRVCLKVQNGTTQTQFRDEGIGISAEHLPHIFERFYRAAPHNSEEVQSGGLGLAIAQAIVRAEGGSIHCQTAVGKGSTFTVNLPIRNHAHSTETK